MTPTLYKKDNQEQHDYLYWKYGGNHAVRSGKWKAVGQPTGNRLQLFDLESDLGETTNVAADNPEIVAQMQQYMIEANK